MGPVQGRSVLVAAAPASPVLRAVTWGVPALLMAGAFIPDEDSTPLQRGAAVVLALALLAWFLLTPRRLAYTLPPDAFLAELARRGAQVTA